jgi:hypothetical protein
LSSGKFDLGVLASRRRVTAKLAGETPALPGANLQFAATDRDFYQLQAKYILQKEQILFCICGRFR